MISLSSLSVDGVITADGEPSKGVNSGGASGGSIWLTTRIFAGNGQITACGGSGKFSNSGGGGGGGGRISASFVNSSFSGVIQTYGGSGSSGAGGAGTIYKRNLVENKTHLIVNNNNIVKSLSDDISDMNKDGGRTWITPKPGTRLISYTDVEIHGHSHLGVLTNPSNSPIQWNIGGIIGDRTGMLHVFEKQTLHMTLKDGKQPDLLWGINTYSRADIKLPQNLFIDGIKMIVSGSVSGAYNVTVGNKGRLILRYVL